MESKAVQNFFDSLSLVANSVVQSSAQDKTIDAVIKKIYNIDTGEYKVEYQGNIFSAYSLNPTVTYKVGERVYVLVPQSDFSLQKVILGRTSFQNSTYETLQATKNFYVDRGPDWMSDFYSDLREEGGICACPVELAHTGWLVSPAHYSNYLWARELPEDKKVDDYYRVTGMTSTELKNADSMLSMWSATSNYIKIQADFNTALVGDHKAGEYQLEVICRKKNPKYDETKTEPEFLNVAFYLGFPEFVGGSPYALNIPTTQTAYYEIPANSLVGLVSIGLIQDGKFKADVPWDISSTGLIIHEEDQAVHDRNNIFISNVKISFAEKVNLTDTMYYPWLETPYGQVVSEGDGATISNKNVLLVPHLQYGDIDLIQATDTCIVKWFVQDPSCLKGDVINSEKDEFNKTYYDYAGEGWYPVGEYIKGQMPGSSSGESGSKYVNIDSSGVFTIKMIEPYVKLKNESLSISLGQDSNKYYKVLDNDHVLITSGQAIENDYYEIREDGSLIVKPAAVPYQRNYKAVICYYQGEQNKNGELVGTYKEIVKTEVKQLVTRVPTKYNLVIESVKDEPNKIFVRDLNDSGEGGAPAREWYAAWFVETSTGSYLPIEGGYPVKGPVDISDYLINGSSIFYAKAYDPYLIDPENDGRLIQRVGEVGVLELVKVKPGAADILVDWTGNFSFNYEADDSHGPFLDLRTDYFIQPHLRFAEGTGSTYSVRIFGPDGTELGNSTWYDELVKSGTPYDVSTSMMTDIWRDTNNAIHFRIRDTFDPEKRDNTFTVLYTFMDGDTFESKREVIFTKDGDNGTIGNEWTAQIKPCFWNLNEGAVADAVFREQKADLTPLVLKPDPDNHGGYIQDMNYRLFLRPFVTRHGIRIEDLDPLEGYYFRATWDVRMPGSAEGLGVPYSSFLRLYHVSNTDPGDIPSATGFPFMLVDDPSSERPINWYYEQGNTNPKDIKTSESKADATYSEHSPNGLCGYTLWPTYPEHDKYGEDSSETYGAVEVRYLDNFIHGTHATMADCHYRFIVKCQVDVMKAQYDQGKQEILVESTFEKIASIITYYPVDIFFNEDKVDLESPVLEDGTPNPSFKFETKIYTNWPTFITYNARGTRPYQMAAPLVFKYGNLLRLEEENYNAYNWTETTQQLQERKIYDKEGNDTGKYNDYYEAKGHLNMTEGFNGALSTIKGKGPAALGSHGWYLRNQIFTMNLYGNVDINGWDGQGLDTNEENGTIFGATFGAGWKERSTNKFTGVIMGIDKSQKREDVIGYNPGDNSEQRATEPYLTGVFGFQDGVQSFGLMENGTAYFGRADGGGRIILDGTNGTIYGGANGEFRSPSIGDNLWNTLRINLVDLTHATANQQERAQKWYQPTVVSAEQDEQYKDVEDGDGDTNYYPILTSVGAKRISQGFEGRFFGFNGDDKTNIMSSRIPAWYEHMWQRAYIKKPGALPYWWHPEGNKTSEQIYTQLDFWDGFDTEDYSAWNARKAENVKVNYFGGWAEVKYLTKDGERTWNEGDQSDRIRQSERDIWVQFDVEGKKESYSYEALMSAPDEETPDMPEGQKILVRAKKIYKEKRENGEPVSISNFGSSRASTTPAIEVGQHPAGLMPGLIDYDEFENVFRELSIPGNRNFLVTYDGTLWAMNGVFMGAVIGSNIIGGRIQGAEIGIGRTLDDFEEQEIFVKFDDTICKWEKLIPPKVESQMVKRLKPWRNSKGRVFTVDSDGNVGASSMKISGGSIDIGTFHIIGKETMSTIKEYDPKGEKEGLSDYGHLVQLGKSDFVGTTHFFGNVGIGPNYSDKDGLGKEKQGSFLQTGGITALGIAFDKDAISEGYNKSHLFMTTYIAKGYNSKLYYTNGKPGEVGEGGSFEQSAVFGIEARHPLALGTPEPMSGNGSRAHLWPLHFRAWLAPDQNNQKKPISFITLMDQFEYIGDSAVQYEKGTSYATSFRGTNYFRIGPWGVEGMDFFVKNTFQSETSCIKPEPKDTSDEGTRRSSGYRGYIGSVARKGYGADSNPPTSGAIGITSWDQNAIILASDEQTAIRSRDSIALYAGTRSDQADYQCQTEKLYGEDTVVKRNATGLVIMGEGGRKESSGQFTPRSSMRGYTSGGEISFFVIDTNNLDDDSFDKEFDLWRAKDWQVERANNGGLAFAGCHVGSKREGNAFFFTTAKDNEHGVHIEAKSSVEGNCLSNTGKPSELFLSKETAILSGAKKLYLQSLAVEKNTNHKEPEDGIGILEDRIFLRIANRGITITKTGIIFTHEADAQSGIYARFG